MDTVDKVTTNQNGGWVRFEDGSNNNAGGVRPSDVQIVLPPPPRKGLSPIPESNASHSSMDNDSHMPPVLSPLPPAELQNIDRVQRILSAQMAPVDLQAATTTTPTADARQDDYENGKILTVLKPSNEKCSWITPPMYHPEMVPQKVLNYIQMPIEDYVACLTLLVKDYRFRSYVVFYKRIIGIWLFVCMIALLAVLFSGLRSINLFAAGLLWLFFAAAGMGLCLYGKRKMNDGLRQVVASTNKFMTQQRLIVGVDDRGKMSMHKVVIAVIHYDVMPCLAQIAHQMEGMRLSNGQPTNSINVHFGATTDLDNVDSTPMTRAEHLLLRCLQVYVKELVRKRLTFQTTKVEDLERTVDMEPTPPMQPRHCKTNWCVCQFVDHMIFRRKPRKWYQKIWKESI